MKKLVAGIVALIVVVGGVVLLLSNNHKTAVTGGNGSSNSSSTYASVDACNIMTSDVASQILGSTAVKGTGPTAGESTSDITFSDCVYTAGPNLDPPHVASVAVRNAKDSSGAASNQSVFTGAGRPQGAQTVTGYGDKAYWDPSMGELNILKGNNWYILSNYTGTAPSNGTATLAMAEQLAQAVTLK